MPDILIRNNWPEAKQSMLNLIKRLLGLTGGNAGQAPRSQTQARKASATGHLFTKDSPALRQTAQADKSQKAPARGAPPRSSFDPYNTGKFDRGASWERISKSQR